MRMWKAWSIIQLILLHYHEKLKEIDEFIHERLNHTELFLCWPMCYLSLLITLYAWIGYSLFERVCCASYYCFMDLIVGIKKMEEMDSDRCNSVWIGFTSKSQSNQLTVVGAQVRRENQPNCTTIGRFFLELSFTGFSNIIFMWNEAKQFHTSNLKQAHNIYILCR